MRRPTFRPTLLLGLIVAILLAGCGRQTSPVAQQPTVQLGTIVAPTAQIEITPTTTDKVVLPTVTPPTAPTGEPIPPIGQTITTEPGRLGPGNLPYPLQLTKLNFGTVGHLYYTDQNLAMNLTQQAGFQWFRQQIHWRDIEDRSGQFFWGDLDGIVNEVNAHGVLLMLSVVRSPTWYTANGGDGLPQDPATLARFVGAIAEHYKGKVQAIEIWNEQNLAYENGGHVSLDDAGHYVELLKASYESIKAVDPSIVVVAGAPSSTATNDPSISMPDQEYLKAMYSYNNGLIKDYFDVQAVHPGGSANAPDTMWPDKPSLAQGWTDQPTFYFRHVENSRKIMEAFGLGRHQIWITEFGWATQNNTPGFEFGNQISFDTQRDYIVGAMKQTYAQYPWVSNMFLWNLNFTILQQEHGVDALNEQGSFSIVNPDGSPRPAFLGVQQTIGEIKAAQAQ